MTPAVMQALVDMHVELNSQHDGRATGKPKPSSTPELDLAQLAAMRVG